MHMLSKPPGVGRRPTPGGPKGHPQGGFLKKWQNSDLRTRYRIHHLCPYDGSKFGDEYFLYEFGPFCCNSCSALGFRKYIILRPPINSVFSARQNCYIAKNGSERSFCLKNGNLWTKVEEKKWNFS